MYSLFDMEYVTCAMCGPSKTTVLSRKGIFKKGGPVIRFQNVICKSCGLVYRNPRPGTLELDGLYHKIYLEKRHSLADEGAALAFLKTVNQKNKGEQVAEFLQGVLNGESHVLDIGSGLGLLGGFLHQKLGVDVLGVEPSELSARVSEQTYGIPVFRGTFDAFLTKRDGRVFDCILLHHVFEHFGDPLGKLRECASILSERGVLYIEVPNVLDFKKPISHFFDSLHLYNYSPATLTGILRLGGFKIIRWNTEKRYRLQILAAPFAHPEPAFAHPEPGEPIARQTIRYCRRKRALELVQPLGAPLRAFARSARRLFS